MSDMFKNFKRRKKNQKPRQEWNPHWSLKGIHGLYHGATAVVKVALGAVATVLLIMMICGFVFVGILGDYLQTDILPNAVEDLEGYDLEQTSFIYYIDNDGDIQELQRIYTATDRRWATIDEIPEDLINAAVAIEDKRFYEHQGVDWITTVKACANMFVGGSSTFGGSTITQQFIKNKTGDDDVTVQRKLVEIFKAIYFESQYDKDVVMEWYLNTIYFGYNKYGVRAAAEQYFGKELELLSTAECAALIGITNNPSLFNPFSESEYEYPRGKGVIRDGAGRNRYRQENILWSMNQEGYLTDEEYKAALAETMEFKTGISDMDRLAHCPDAACGYYGTVSTFVVEEEAGRAYYCPSCGAATEVDLSGSKGVYSWFTEAVMDDVCKDLAKLDGNDWDKMTTKEREVYLEQLKIGGYHIYSTIDMEVQAQLDKIYTDLKQIPTTKSSQQLWSAMVITDNQTGDIIAIAGNVGEKTAYDALSYATEAKLQTGSAQKPLTIYAPAFEEGLITPATVVKDMPLYYNDGSPFPRNENKKYNYARSIYSGLVSSINTIAVNTLDELGLQDSYDFAKTKFRLQGLTDSYIASNGRELTDIGYSPLGMGALTQGVTVRDMAAAYTTFANDGVYREARTYTKVYDSEGKLVLDNTQETEQILSKKTVNYVNYCLTGAVNDGTGTAAKISGQNVAGKTGSTSSNRDRWFCGYTEYYTAAVWCGYQWPEAIKLTGSDTRNPACRLFAKVMTPLHEGLAKKQLYSTSDMRSYTMCLDSGKRASSACTRTATAYAYSGDVPSGTCGQHTSVDYCTTGGGAANEYCKLMGASISSTSLVKLNSDEVKAIRDALKCGLKGGYPDESEVYYTGGSWHGYSGSTQSGNTHPYLVCTAHNATTYAQYLASQAPQPGTPGEGGEGGGTGEGGGETGGSEGGHGNHNHG